ncbi:MAG: GntR family transcriptional regulator [Galactobacter sp.]
MKASDRAYEEVRRDIVEWRLQPGASLLEVELAARLGISRTPVREAIAKLLSDGLAVNHSGRVTVSDVRPESVDQLFDLRVCLETMVARGAAEAAASSATVRARFDELAQRFDAATPVDPVDPSGYYALTHELDDALDAAANNPYLLQALRGLRLHLDRVRRLSQDHPDRLDASASEHAAIASAVAHADSDLAQAQTVVHLHHAQAHIKTYARDTAVTLAG